MCEEDESESWNGVVVVAALSSGLVSLVAAKQWWRHSGTVFRYKTVSK